MVQESNSWTSLSMKATDPRTMDVSTSKYTKKSRMFMHTSHRRANSCFKDCEINFSTDLEIEDAGSTVYQNFFLLSHMFPGINI